MPEMFHSTSRKRLDTCHPAHQDLFLAVLQRRDIAIACGYRCPREQAKLYAQGRTAPGDIVTNARPGQSLHGRCPSLAADVVPYPERWDSVEAFEALAPVVFEEWDKLHWSKGFTLRWGGHWPKPDRPHWEIHERI